MWLIRGWVKYKLISPIAHDVLLCLFCVHLLYITMLFYCMWKLFIWLMVLFFLIFLIFWGSKSIYDLVSSHLSVTVYHCIHLSISILPIDFNNRNFTSQREPHFITAYDNCQYRVVEILNLIGVMSQLKFYSFISVKICI